MSASMQEMIADLIRMAEALAEDAPKHDNGVNAASRRLRVGMSAIANRCKELRKVVQDQRS